MFFVWRKIESTEYLILSIFHFLVGLVCLIITIILIKSILKQSQKRQISKYINIYAISGQLCNSLCSFTICVAFAITTFNTHYPDYGTKIITVSKIPALLSFIFYVFAQTLEYALLCLRLQLTFGQTIYASRSGCISLLYIFILLFFINQIFTIFYGSPLGGYVCFNDERNKIKYIPLLLSTISLLLDLLLSISLLSLFIKKALLMVSLHSPSFDSISQLLSNKDDNNDNDNQQKVFFNSVQRKLLFLTTKYAILSSLLITTYELHLFAIILYNTNELSAEPEWLSYVQFIIFGFDNLIGTTVISLTFPFYNIVYFKFCNNCHIGCNHLCVKCFFRISRKIHQKKRRKSTKTSSSKSRWSWDNIKQIHIKKEKEKDNQYKTIKDHTDDNELLLGHSLTVNAEPDTTEYTVSTPNIDHQPSHISLKSKQSGNSVHSVRIPSITSTTTSSTTSGNLQNLSLISINTNKSRTVTTLNSQSHSINWIKEIHENDS